MPQPQITFGPSIDTRVSNYLTELWTQNIQKLGLPEATTLGVQIITDGKSKDNVYLVKSAHGSRSWIVKDFQLTSPTQHRLYSCGSKHITQIRRDLSDERFLVFDHANMRSDEQYRYLIDFIPELPGSVLEFFTEIGRLASDRLIEDEVRKSSNSYLSESYIGNRRAPDKVILGKRLYGFTDHTINLLTRHIDLPAAEDYFDEDETPIRNVTLTNIRTLDIATDILVFSSVDGMIYWVICQNPEHFRPKTNYRYNLLLDKSAIESLSNYLSEDIVSIVSSMKHITSLSTQIDRVSIYDQHGDLHTKNVVFSKTDFLIFDMGSAKQDISTTDYARFCISLLKDIAESGIKTESAEEIIISLATSSQAYFGMIAERLNKAELLLALEIQRLLFARSLVEQLLATASPGGGVVMEAEAVKKFDQYFQLFSNTLDRRTHTPLDEPVSSSRPRSNTVSALALPSESGKVHPKLIALLRSALTRSGNEYPLGLANSFFDHFIATASLPAITPLQSIIAEKAIGDMNIFMSDAHILMSGPTSSGKTTASDLFLFRTIFVNDGGNARALFLSPTKALAHEKYESLNAIFDGFSFPDIQRPVLISTGDESEADPLIASGNFRIACTVYEKANILFSRNPSMLSQIGLVVIDELHMFMDLERGPMLELIAAKLQSSRSQLEFQTAPTDMEMLRPRILGISTDPDLVRAFRDPLTIERFNQEPLPPIEISDPTRPTEVRHTLVMPTGARCEYKLIPIGSSTEGNFPQLPSTRRASIVNEAIDAFWSYKKAETQARAERSAIASKEQRTQNFLIELLRNKPLGERVLCFVPTRAMAESVAAELAAGRVDEYRSNPAVFMILSAGFSHIEDQAVRSTLESFSKSGIFVHHSDLPSETLRSIEEICRTSMLDGASSEVIVATQTLSYGVNLAISTVCVAGQMFFTGFRDGEARQAHLTNCEYHNMVGRCGRLGRTSRSVSDAFVLFDIFRNTNENAIDSFVRQYYSSAPPFDSVVYTAEDADAERRVRSRLFFRFDARGDTLDSATATELVEGVTKFSLPFVRAVLDALRHLNFETVLPANAADPTYVSSEDIAALFRHTPFGKKFLSERDKSQKISAVFEFILRALKQREYRLIVDSRTSDFLITERGDAILNTGMSIQTIQQFQRYIYLCESAFSNIKADIEDFSVLAPYIYIIIVAAQNDALRMGAQYTEEYTISAASDDAIDAAKQEVIDDFSELLAETIGSSVDIAARREIFEFLFDAMAGISLSRWGEWSHRWTDTQFFSDFDKIGDKRLLTLAVFRLANFTLAWMLGRSSKEMERFLRQHGADGRRMKRFMGKGRFFESISYGVVFFSALVRTASDKKDVRNEQLGHRLRLLAEQIRVGLRADFLPFASLQSRRVTRQDIVALCNSGLTVSHVLNREIAGAVLPQGITEEAVRQTVYNYFYGRFLAFSSVWAEKGRASQDRLLSNLTELWNFLNINYFKIIEKANRTDSKGTIISRALEELFRSFDKKIELSVFGFGESNTSISPILTWIDKFDLCLDYFLDEDESTKRRCVFIRFLECDDKELCDLAGRPISTSDLSNLKYDEYWLVNVTPNQKAKRQMAEQIKEKMRMRSGQRLCIMELDALFVVISSILRGFYVSMDECLEMFNGSNIKHVTMIEVVSSLNPRETVGQILKASIEYTSLWSFQNDIQSE